nr:hypothetical protein [Tanacetum cinerariifolium]
MGRDTVQLEIVVSTISQEYLLEFTSEYGISEALHPELPGPEDRIVDFPEGKDGMPAENTYSPEAVMILNTYHIDLFNLIRAPNPTKVKTCSRPRAAHEVPLTVTANRVIEMEDPAAATDSSGVPSTIERSPLDFANENPSQQSTGPEDQEATTPEVSPPENVTTMGIAPEAGPAERVAAMGPPVVKERRKRSHDEVDTNAPPKVLRRDHADPRPTEGTRGGKSLAFIKIGMGSTRPVPALQGAHVDVSDPDPLSFVDPPSRPSADVTQSFKGVAAAGDPKSKNTSFTSMVGSPESIYRPERGITNGCLLDAPEACQDLVDHIAPPRYFLELRHLHNDDFLKQYNVNLARSFKGAAAAGDPKSKNTSFTSMAGSPESIYRPERVAMGSQLRLRFEQEAKLLKKSVAQVARRDKRIQARENEIKNLETLLEAESDMKKTAKNKSAELSAELENMRALFSDLQEFKKNEHDMVEQCCAKMDARIDALSIDFDEELYPHMLTAIAGRSWVIVHGLRLAAMKCGESTELRQAFADVVSAGIAKGMS